MPHKPYRDHDAAGKKRLAANAQRWRRANMAKFRATERERGRMRRYGLTPEAYDALVEKQDHRCAICRIHCEPYDPSARRRTALHVDHAHDTGTVRSLLCNGCNRGLGFFNDDPARLRAAAEYLAECADMIAQRQAAAHGN